MAALGREPPSEPVKAYDLHHECHRAAFCLLRRGIVAGSPKLCSMESSFTLLRVAKDAERLGPGYRLVGLQPTIHNHQDTLDSLKLAPKYRSASGNGSAWKIHS
jgi:hypothetical protein